MWQGVGTYKEIAGISLIHISSISVQWPLWECLNGNCICRLSYTHGTCNLWSLPFPSYTDDVHSYQPDFMWNYLNCIKWRKTFIFAKCSLTDTWNNRKSWFICQLGDSLFAKITVNTVQTWHHRQDSSFMNTTIFNTNGINTSRRFSLSLLYSCYVFRLLTVCWVI